MAREPFEKTRQLYRMLHSVIDAFQQHILKGDAPLCGLKVFPTGFQHFRDRGQLGGD